MPKLYGDRWEIIDGPRLGGGGQGEVFRVRDISGALEGEFALKRVINVKRRERFRREVEAIKRLTDPQTRASHPNIVSLVDHSALEEEARDERQFIVMPLALGGDLGSLERIALYKDSIDSSLQVAKQLAQAIRAAHQANIIHRDIKPQNILFPGIGHDTWLSDFGICLITDAPRITPTPEIVGPRAFMAPELENGGQLDVSPAADIYSLGKVIYYMIAGGVVLPRENLNDAKYKVIFDRGQRYHLVEMLLNRMVCPLDRRLQSADKVLVEIEKIQNWEKNAQLLSMSAEALAAVQKLQQRSMDTARITQENADARRQEGAGREAIQTSLTAWLEAELRKIAAAVQSESITCSIQQGGVDNFRMPTGHNSMLTALKSIGLVLCDKNDRLNRSHVLQYVICEQREGLVQVTVLLPGQKAAAPGVTPARDIEFALVPIYLISQPSQNQRAVPSVFYVSQPQKVGSLRTRYETPKLGQAVRRQQPLMINYRIESMMAQFESEVALLMKFRASEWPAKEAEARELVEKANEVFFTHVAS